MRELRTQDTSPTAPVAIAGAGPVGQTVALLLARYGIRSVLLDQRERRDAVGSKSICQQRDVLDIWSFVGAGERIAAEGVTWARARTFHRDTELFCRELGQGAWSPFPPFVNISQSRTEQILDELIAASPLIETRWGHRVTGVRAADGVLETVRGPVSASYIVLACGSRSQELRDQLGVSFDGESFDDRFLICDIRTDLGDWASERRFYFDPVWNPGRQVLIHPCPDSTYRIDWQVPASFDPAAEGALDQRIRSVIGNRPYDVVWKSVYRFQSRVASRFRVGRVLLAGDCAHVYSPFGARGLNSGVADAENLAWKLAFVLRGWASDTLLASYHDERHAAALENLAVTSATMRFLIPPDPAAHRHRLDVLTRAATDPDAWPLVDSGRLSEPFRYADSPLTTPPAPGALIPDAPIGPTRLRTLTRGHLTTLTGPSVDLPSVRHTLDTTTDAPSTVLPMPTVPPNEIWLLRPDAHLAAVLRDPGASLAAAIRTLLP